MDHFLGDKIFITDSLGNDYPSSGTIVSFKAGPELFVTKNISIMALYGFAKYQLYDYKSHTGNFKLSLTVRPPKHPKMLIGFQYSKLTGDYSNVHFWGINIGSRIL